MCDAWQQIGNHLKSRYLVCHVPFKTPIKRRQTHLGYGHISQSCHLLTEFCQLFPNLGVCGRFAGHLFHLLLQ